jgi:hypothetical protein
MEPLNAKLYDPIRKEWVADQPEERVRQAFIKMMTEQLEYPAALIGIEKALDQMAHITTPSSEIPERRADIIVYGKGSTGLFPLLLVECKAVPLTEATVRQVTGYNHYVKALFVAMVNQTEIRTGWLDKESGSLQWAPTLPTYPSLMTAAGLPDCA